MTAWRLVADVGGTNVRFARADARGTLDAVRTMPTSAAASFLEALHDYLRATGGNAHCASCAIGAAGPVDGDTVTLTNLDWTITRAGVSAALGGAPVTLVNDLEAVAAALPHLAADDLAPIGGPAVAPPEDLRSRLAINVGTGFGAALALRRGARWWTLPSEAGHMRLDICSAVQRDALGPCRTVEDLLSGRGLAELYDRLSGGGSPRRDPSAVLAPSGEDRHARRAVEIVTDVLGRVTGDLTLATAAWGGVMLTGSVAEGWSKVADPARFRRAFEGEGPMRARLARTPTALIERPHVALLGLAMLPAGEG